MKISVITPCFNSEATLRETMESIHTQQGVGFEHLVMDGGSKDGTRNIVREFPRAQLFCEKDRGHFDAMNKGIARASGDVIVILNADDCFRPDTLNAASAAMTAHPEWDACFGDFLFVDANGHEITRRAEVGYDFKVLLHGLDYICHHTLFVRKSTYERIGNYRFEPYPFIADYEFKLRLGREKCQVGHIPQFLVNYRIHGAQVSTLRARQMEEEARRLRLEYGGHNGMAGRVLQYAYRAKRQFQKLLVRGRCDLIPGNWLLNKHRGG